MRYLIMTFVFLMTLGSAAQAQQQPLTPKALASDASAATKATIANAELGAKAASFASDSPARRTVAAGTSKSVTPEESEPESWRMVAAAVLFMFVIAMRRQGSGRP